MLDIASTPRDRAEDHRDVLSRTVDQTVRTHLGAEKIVSVASWHDEDFDGDEIISISVVINTSPANFEGRALSSLARALRSSLAEIDVYAFPMVSYMTVAEKEARRK